MAEQKQVEIVFGAIQFGQFLQAQGRTLPFATVDQARPKLDAFRTHGYSKVDTARSYGGGFSEKLPAETNSKSRPLEPQNVPYSDAPDDLRADLQESLDALDNHVDSFYLCAPDRAVSYADTLAEINRLQ